MCFKEREAWSSREGVSRAKVGAAMGRGAGHVAGSPREMVRKVWGAQGHSSHLGVPGYGKGKEEAAGPGGAISALSKERRVKRAGHVSVSWDSITLMAVPLAFGFQTLGLRIQVAASGSHQRVLQSPTPVFCLLVC